jgi:biotin transporter BioY
MHEDTSTSRRSFGANLFAARRLQELPRSWRAVSQCLCGSIALALVTFVCFLLRLNLATVVCLSTNLTIIVLACLLGSFLSSAVVSFIAVGYSAWQPNEGPWLV